MANKKLSPHAPCPCGSGKKYQACCITKGFEWQEDDEGGLYRSVPMTGEMAGLLDEQRLKFIEKFGREPGPDDPIFFDMPHAEHLEAIMVEGMKAAGINPAFIHAFEKTGLLVTEENQHLISDKDLEAWDAAVREYEEKHRGRGESGRY